MAMKAGADYKYHWLLQQAEMELGSSYFNPLPIQRRDRF